MESEKQFKLEDRVIERFVALVEGRKDIQFEIGDELNVQFELYGKEKKQVVNQLAGALNISASTLYDYARIAKKWDETSRAKYTSLDWTIIRNSDPTEDEELLDQCVDENLNATEFKLMKYPNVSSPTALFRAVHGKLFSLEQDERIGSKAKEWVGIARASFLKAFEMYEKDTNQ